MYLVKYAAEQTNDPKVERDDVVDQLLTGRYLISKVHHQIDTCLIKNIQQSLTVVRNVFATDLPNADTFKQVQISGLNLLM